MGQLFAKNKSNSKVKQINVKSTTKKFKSGKVKPVAEIKPIHANVTAIKSEMGSNSSVNSKSQSQVGDSLEILPNQVITVAEKELESETELFDTGNRFGSAGSKNSQKSRDSGLEMGDPYELTNFGDLESTVITEESSSRDIYSVTKSFLEPEESLDFGLVGTACPQRLSAKDKNRMEEQRILASLRNEGLISRPKARAAGGMSFEIVSENIDNFSLPAIARPPPRLMKLEKRKKKKKTLTEADIAAKLERAEERKRIKEQERLDKINQLDRSRIPEVQAEVQLWQKDLEQEQSKKLYAVSDNRENKLKELQAKLKNKAAHAEMVRQRKKLIVESSENWEYGQEEHIQS